MAEGTDVTLDGLRDFVTTMTRVRGDVQVTAFEQLGPVSGANIGSSRIPGSGAAKASYQRMAESLTMFLTDVGYNAQALTNTATIVASNYQHGDTSQQAQMNSVMSAFQPPPGTTTIQSEAARLAAQDREARLAQARIDRGLGNGPVQTASGLTLTGRQAEMVLQSQARDDAGTAGVPHGAGDMDQVQRMTLVTNSIDAQHEQLRLASAQRRAVAWDAEGNPTEWDMVAPESYAQASGAGEANTSTESEYEEAQDWAEQEEADGYEASVTVGENGEVERESNRPPTPAPSTYPYSTTPTAMSATTYPLGSGGGS